MRKFLTVLFIFALAALSMTGALAVIPHGHGDDLDHSRHASCPVHQAGLQTTAFVLAVWAFALLLQVAVRHELAESFFISFSRFNSPSLRAPPSLA
ncbi:MAG: hypothetical protein ACREH5_02370 [Candidatus Omnitrophota bacterium]